MENNTLSTSPNKGIRIYSHDEVLNKFLGTKGTPKRNAFDNELRLDIQRNIFRTFRVKL
jgi:hypothetical protein